jgi:olefin beta-lactone synthetase
MTTSLALPVLPRPRDPAARPTRHPAGAMPADTTAAGNLTSLLLDAVAHAPGRTAVVEAEGAGTVTYAALAARAGAFQRGLRDAGHVAGDRILVLGRPSAEFHALALAVLAGGMTLVLVDGRLGPARVLGALHDARPDGVVAPPALVRWWPLVGVLRRARRWTMGGHVAGTRALSALGARAGVLEVVPVPADAPAIASFTSGTTGRAKRIVRSHAVLLAQHRALATAFPLEAGDVTLTAFPVALLHNLCCGATTVLPPTNVEPAALAALVRAHGVTSLSAAPALVGRLARQALREGVPLDTLRDVVVGGGPVSRRLCDEVRRAFPAARGHVVYGATEAEPIATVGMEEVRAARGDGFLVGRPVGHTSVAVQDGELLVRGPQVIGGRDRWHHTGDLTRADDAGRLWLLGRVGSTLVHRGRIIEPYVVEADVLDVAGVAAAGLVAHRRAPEGELAVEVEEGCDAGIVTRAVRDRLTSLAMASLPVRLAARIPMDARHASKVQRGELARLLERSAR